MKKIIKVNFTGFWDGFDYKKSYLYEILKEYYDVEVSDTPDYLFISVFDKSYSFCKFDGIRIFYTGENVVPDFNLFDYAIGFNRLNFGDRYFRYPLSYDDVPTMEKAINSRKEFDCEDINRKQYFASFMYSHEGMPERSALFRVMNNYKPVVSVGKYLKNCEIEIPFDLEQKLLFQGKAKFVIAVENESSDGYSTEKLLHAFASGSIPVYYGDPLIASEFNNKAFVNCHEYENFESVLEAIKRIDEDDSLYLSVMHEPVFVTSDYHIECREALEKFIRNIFDQNYNEAFRRSTNEHIVMKEKYLCTYCDIEKQLKELRANESILRKIKRVYEKEGISGCIRRLMR